MISTEDDDAMVSSDIPEPHRRRMSDVVVDLLAAQIDGVSQRLEKHVQECSRQSRRLFWGLIATLGWLIAHSPEFGKLITKIIAGLQP